MTVENAEFAAHFTHVEDAARAFWQAAAPSTDGGVYNIACEDPITNLEFGRTVAAAASVPLSVVPSPPLPDYVPRRGRLPGSRAMADLGWRPEISLETGIRRELAIVQRLGTDRSPTVPGHLNTASPAS